MDDSKERPQKLTKGKDLLLERNKHTLLAEKYGWDTVTCYTCYTAEPLASDSDDEKKIRKAVKESKQQRGRRKEALLLRSQGRKE